MHLAFLSNNIFMIDMFLIVKVNIFLNNYSNSTQKLLLRIYSLYIQKIIIWQRIKANQKNRASTYKIISIIVKIMISNFEQRQQNQKLINQTNRSMVRIIEKFRVFSNTIMRNLESKFRMVEQNLLKQIDQLKKKISIKLQNNLQYKFTYQHQEISINQLDYQNQLSKTINKIQSKFVKEFQNYLDLIINRNLYKEATATLLHHSNTIINRSNTWTSVTSKQPLVKSVVYVQGFDDIKTTYFAIGVSTKQKHSGICNNLKKEDFLGICYLNDSQNIKEKLIEQSNSKKVSLGKQSCRFIIEDIERRLYIHKQGNIRKQVLILDDDLKYYLYIAWKGPIQIIVK